MSRGLKAIAYSVIFIGTGFILLQFAPATDLPSAQRDNKQRQQVLDVMLKASGDPNSVTLEGSKSS